MGRSKYDGCPPGLAIIRHPSDDRYAIIHDLTGLAIAGGFGAVSDAKRLARRLAFADWTLSIEDIPQHVRDMALRVMGERWRDQEADFRLKGVDPQTRAILRGLAADLARQNELTLSERIRLADFRAQKRPAKT